MKIYPVYRCKNCGETIVVKKITDLKGNFKNLSDVFNSGYFDNQSNPKLHKCLKQPELDIEGDFYVALKPIGYVKEREEVQNEVIDGESDSGDKEGNGETDIDK